MKKRKSFLLVLFSVLFLFMGTEVSANDGNLQLNPSVITNSEGGVANTSSFPIIGELFSPEMNQIIAEQMQDNIAEKQGKLNFSEQSMNSLHKTDTEHITEKLFINYKPQVIVSSSDDEEIQSSLWYVLFVLFALPLVFFAVNLGRKNAKRSLRKKR